MNMGDITGLRAYEFVLDTIESYARKFKKEEVSGKEIYSLLSACREGLFALETETKDADSLKGELLIKEENIRIELKNVFDEEDGYENE